MGFCCAVNCDSKTIKGAPSGVSFFGFPKDPKLQKKWCDMIRRENFVPQKYSKICSKHFKSEDILRIFGQRKLREGAIPCIFQRSKESKPARKPPANRKQSSENHCPDQNTSENPSTSSADSNSIPTSDYGVSTTGSTEEEVLRESTNDALPSPRLEVVLNDDTSQIASSSCPDQNTSLIPSSISADSNRIPATEYGCPDQNNSQIPSTSRTDSNRIPTSDYGYPDQNTSEIPSISRVDSNRIPTSDYGCPNQNTPQIPSTSRADSSRKQTSGYGCPDQNTTQIPSTSIAVSNRIPTSDFGHPYQNTSQIPSTSRADSNRIPTSDFGCADQSTSQIPSTSSEDSNRIPISDHSCADQNTYQIPSTSSADSNRMPISDHKKRRSYVGDFELDDMLCPTTATKFFNVATTDAKRSKKKISALRKRITGLENKAKYLSSMLELCQEKLLQRENSAYTVMVMPVTDSKPTAGVPQQSLDESPEKNSAPLDLTKNTAARNN